MCIPGTVPGGYPEYPDSLRGGFLTGRDVIILPNHCTMRSRPFTHRKGLPSLPLFCGSASHAQWCAHAAALPLMRNGVRMPRLCLSRVEAAVLDGEVADHAVQVVVALFGGARLWCGMGPRTLSEV